jgi:HSP20 family protein
MELVLANGWNGNQWMFDSLNRFRQAIDEAASGHATGDHMVPQADVVEDKDAYHFYVEMPGLKDGSIDVHVEDDRLMVASERKRPEWPQETGVHLAERNYGTIRRAFRLPLNASRDGIRAAYTDGVLEVTVEKRPESKPVKIQVN